MGHYLLLPTCDSVPLPPAELFTPQELHYELLLLLHIKEEKISKEDILTVSFVRRIKKNKPNCLLTIEKK